MAGLTKEKLLDIIRRERNLIEVADEEGISINDKDFTEGLELTRSATEHIYELEYRRLTELEE